MRVIAGVYRGRRLESPSDAATRPTSDRLRETLFNIVALRVRESRFADVCAGTGAVGIEALSRGASHVTFIDKSRAACALIRHNLESLQAPLTSYEIICRDAYEYLQWLTNHAQQSPEIQSAVDIIFYDPPYAANYLPVLQTLATASSGLSQEAICIVESFHKHELPVALGNLRRWRLLKQGDSALSFYESVVGTKS